MFVPFVFTLDERPWSKNYAQGDIFYIYADACIEYGWPLIAPERYFKRFSKVEEPFWNMSMRDFADYFCMRRVPTEKDMLSIRAYPIPQTEEDSIIGKYPSKMDCLNDLLTNENNEFEKILGSLLDEIQKDYQETPEGILCFEILPKSLVTAANERGIPVIFQQNGLFRIPLYKPRLNPKTTFINCMSIVANPALENISVRYKEFLSDMTGLPMLSRKGILRLFFSEQYMMDIHNIDNEPEYDVGIIHNCAPGINFFGRRRMPDSEMSSRVNEKYDSILTRTRKDFQVFAENISATAWDNSPSCFHFCCRCNRVVGTLTKGMFDAMLAGRIAHEYGDFMFSDYCNNGIEDDSIGIAPLEYINFVIFGLWAPLPWLTESENLRYAVANTFRKDRYMRCFDYYTQGISKKDLELYYMTSRREYRVGDMLYFSDGHLPHEYASYYCTGGLHVPAGTHTWSSGEITSFEFDLIESINEPLAITVLLNEVAMDWNTPNPAQAVECDVNGINCGSAILTPQIKYMRFTVPAECFSDKLRVTFRYSYLHLSGETKIAVAFVSMYVKCGSQRLIEDELFSELERHNSENKRLNAELARLSAVNAEMNGVVASIYNSRSWKLGHGVLRVLKRIFRN